MNNTEEANPNPLDPHPGPAGGWEALRAVEASLFDEGRAVSGNAIILKMNKTDGFACVSCAWAKPAEPRPFEFCENGVKATAWELTDKRATPEFFDAHTLAELRSWTDHDLEDTGRLTHPLRWDPATDKYHQVAWEDAFREIGRELRAVDPRAVVLYCSGRASLEASYMWALFARLLGTNNLPDSSNMCHESTSVALPESIGVPVGTVTLDDFEHTDAIFFFGQNVGTNSPRMLHPLQEASRRGVPIVTFNPLREPGLESFRDPQSVAQMATGGKTRISSQYHQVKAGGDIAAVMGVCKALLEADEAAVAAGAERLIDTEFIAEHTHGFEAFAERARGSAWRDLEEHSGLTRQAMEGAAAVLGRAKAVMAVYGMGLTQHRKGVEAVQMVVNMLLLRGSIGKPGAGICPVRGHSNVQGQRTVGISEKPELVPLDTLAAQFSFEPPRWKGRNTVETCEGVLNGDVRAFVALGGNFIRAVPETTLMEEAWSRLRLTVQIATKLNRSHLVHGEISYLLPCLGRIEIDTQASGAQAVTVEDSTAFIHGSKGVAAPASPHLLSEPAIIAGLAKETLPPNPNVPWDEWVGNYDRIRDAIARTYPDTFRDFNARMFTPGGFPRPIPARNRQWKTQTGKANFILPAGLHANPDAPADGLQVFQLITLRSNDQFNTTVYSDDDRYRGVKGTRRVLFMNPRDIERLGFANGDVVSVATAVDDGVERRIDGLRVTAYDIPAGCCGGYYPECNPLLPLWHHAERAKVPAGKSIPVRVSRAG